MPGLRLQHRIVIPFAIIAIVATAAAAFVSLSVTSNALQSRFRSQLLSAAAVISRSDLALNRLSLQQLHEIIAQGESDPFHARILQRTHRATAHSAARFTG